MTENRKPHLIVLRLVAVLLILVTLSTSMVVGRYARYVTSASGSDSARVAKFEVNEEICDFPTQKQHVGISIDPGSTENTDIIVENASEVAVRYYINVTNPYHNLPLSFQIKVGEALYSLPFEADMAPGTDATYTLVTSWAGVADISYSGKVDLIEISLSATQID